MLKNIKIVFIDLDGTLTNNNKTISERNIQALEYLKKKGIYLVFASGRWDNYILNYTRNLNICDFAIANQGACIIDINKRKILKEDIIPSSEVKKITNYCYKKQLKLTFSSFLTTINISSLIDYNKIMNQENIQEPIYQGIIICKTKQEINQLITFINSIPDLYISYISSAYYQDIPKNSYTVNINFKRTNKGNAVNYLLNELGIKKEQSLCFGDNYNDLSMFENCGVKVAMNNASKELKEKATYITLNNNEDGVAYFIENNL